MNKVDYLGEQSQDLTEGPPDDYVPILRIMKEMAKAVPDAAAHAPVTIRIDERADGVAPLQ